MKQLIVFVAALALTSSIADAACNGSCTVGSLGTGGEKSGGKAQGEFGRETFQGDLGPVTEKFVGGVNSGHIEVTGSVTGTASGAYLNGVQHGHLTGVFGTCSGRC
jgi:hypothetical protein